MIDYGVLHYIIYNIRDVVFQEILPFVAKTHQYIHNFLIVVTFVNVSLFKTEINNIDFLTIGIQLLSMCIEYFCAIFNLLRLLKFMEMF